MKKIILLLIISSFSLVSCEKNEPQCWEIAGSGVTSVEGETQTSVNEPLELTIQYRVFNDCGNFYTFFEEISEGIKWITVNVKYDGCSCNPQVQIKSEVYTFMASQAGTYVLRFKVTNAEFIEKSITVTP